MEQLRLRPDEFNKCTEERAPMLSKNQQVIKSTHERNNKVKLLVDEFFATLPPDILNKPSRWTLVATHLNQHPESMNGRGRPWSPQGLARVYKMALLWQRREASPNMVTPTRRRIFQLIVHMLDSGSTWIHIADVLNQQGLYWNPKGGGKRPFTNKSANDFYRMHRDLWPLRPRTGSGVQKSLSQLQLLGTMPPKQDEPKRAAPADKVADDRPVATSVEEHVTNHNDATQTVRHSKVAGTTCPAAPRSDGEEVQVFKQVHDNTSVKVVVRYKAGVFSVAVKYAGKGGSPSALQMAAVVQNLKSMDYRD